MTPNNITAKTFWVWTELTESLHPERKAGTKVWSIHEKTAPRSWFDKGFIREAAEEELPEGQTTIFDFM